jgi:hypothetical protein
VNMSLQDVVRIQLHIFEENVLIYSNIKRTVNVTVKSVN